MKRLKHDFEARLRYMAMLEEGYSIRAVARLTGMCHHDLDVLWLRYQSRLASSKRVKLANSGTGFGQLSVPGRWITIIKTR